MASSEINLALTVFGIAWCFWLGAALGSYLNVLVYRMPLGLGTVAPDSRCPKCKTPIRWHDNIPIVGWLALGGKCRACHEPISPRYLIVEAFVGVLFALLLAVEVLTGGANLPGRILHRDPGMPVVEHFMQGDLVGIYAYHATLIWLVTGIALFAIDSNRVPRAYAIAALVLIVTPPLLWPVLHPVPTWLPLAVPGIRHGMLDAVTGVGTGVVLGCLLSLALRSEVRRKALAAMALLGALVGGALGWHAALMWFAISACAWVLHVLTCLWIGKRSPLPLVVIAATGLLALVIGWSAFYMGFPQPISRPEHGAATHLTTVAALSLLPIALSRYLAERSDMRWINTS